MLAGALKGAAGPRTVLDIGCGDGSAAAVAAPLLAGHRLVGVDWSQDALCRARTRLPYAVRGELTGGGLPFASRAVDAVLFAEVVERLVDPDPALAEIRRVLRPDGRLLLSTPNLAAWYDRALLLAGVQPVFSEVSLRAAGAGVDPAAARPADVRGRAGCGGQWRRHCWRTCPTAPVSCWRSGR